MRIEIKKIIAKEFLVLMLSLGIGLVLFIGISVYNSYLWNHCYKLNTIIINKQKLADSLKTLNWEPPYDAVEVVPIADKSDTKKKYDFSSFDSAVNKSSKKSDPLSILPSNTDLLNLQIQQKKKRLIFANQTKKINQDLYALNKQTNDIKLKTFYENNTEGQTKFIELLLTILLGTLFGLRYLFYAIIWSLKTLKQ